MKYLHSFKNFLNESKVSKDKDHEITQAGNIWVLVYKIKHKTFKHHFGSEKEAEEFWNSKKENLREGKTDNVINEDFPGPGETVLAKDITPSVLDYFDRTNKKLLIDTKTKKGIKGEVGRMYNDLVFNGDTIQLKDIIQVKILESTNDAVNEDQHFLNFRYATGMDKIQIDSIENYRKEQKPTTEFEKAAKPFGSLPGVFVFTPQTPKEVETIKLLATKHSVFGIWAVNNKGAEVFITRAS